VPFLPQGLDLQVVPVCARPRQRAPHCLRNASSAPRSPQHPERTAPARRDALLAAVLALVSALLLYPIGQSVYYSFTQWDGLTATWVGTSTTHAAPQPGFSAGAQEQRDAPAGGSGAIGIPLVVAFLLSSHLPGWRFLPHGVLLPTAVSWVVIAIARFRRRGHPPAPAGRHRPRGVHPNMLSHPRSALAAVAITFIWGMFGTNLIIFLAGMSTIDTSLYEAPRWTARGNSACSYRSRAAAAQVRAVRVHHHARLGLHAIFSLIYIMTAGGPASPPRRSSLRLPAGFARVNFGTAATPACCSSSPSPSSVSSGAPVPRGRRMTHSGSRDRSSTSSCRITVVMLYPFYYMITTSLQSSTSTKLGGGGVSLTSWRHSSTSSPCGGSCSTRRCVRRRHRRDLLVSTAGRSRLRDPRYPPHGRIPARRRAMMVPLQSIIAPEFINVVDYWRINHLDSAIIVYAALAPRSRHSS